MAKKLLQTFAYLFVLIVVPLLPHPELLMTWPVWAITLAGIALNMTQPAWSTKELSSKTSKDRFSMNAILIAGILGFLFPVLDYGYLRMARPDMLQFWSWIGLFATAGGLALRIYAIRILGKFFTARVVIQEGQRVITRGPYRWIRHPSYLGTFIMFHGLALVTRSFLTIVFLWTAFLAVYVYRITLEEKALENDLGPEYTEFKRRTWRLFPYLY